MQKVISESIWAIGGGDFCLLLTSFGKLCALVISFCFEAIGGLFEVHAVALAARWRL